MNKYFEETTLEQFSREILNFLMINMYNPLIIKEVCDILVDMAIIVKGAKAEQKEFIGNLS